MCVSENDREVAITMTVGEWKDAADVCDKAYKNVARKIREAIRHEDGSVESGLTLGNERG